MVSILRRCLSVFSSVLFAACFSSLTFASHPSEDPPPPELIDEATQLTEILRSPESIDGIDGVIERRASLLNELLHDHPKAVGGLMLSKSEVQNIRKYARHSADKLERWSSHRGKLQQLFVTDLEGRRRMESNLRKPNGERKSVHFVGGSDPQPQGDVDYLILGAEFSGQLFATEATSQGVAAAAASNLGEQRMVVLLVNFQDRLETTPTSAQAQAVLFGATNSLDAYWRETSYGKTFAGGDVFGWYTLPVTAATGCDIYTMRDLAIQAADADVYFPQYDRLVIVIPDASPGVCPFGGIGELGAVSRNTNDGPMIVSTMWVRGVDLKTTAHEGGHGLSLGHSGYQKYTDSAGTPLSTGPLGSLFNSTWIEYADPYDVMGIANSGHYNSPHKNRLGWFDPSHAQTVTSSGTFVLTPYETTGTATKALKIRRGDVSTKVTEWIWVENRQPIGFDAVYAGTPVTNGALLYLDRATNGISNYTTEILDMVLLPFPYTDYPLTVGSNWTDTHTGINIRADSLSNGDLTVTVTVPPLAVISNTPVDGAANLLPSTTLIKSTFSKPMNPATVNASTVTLSANGTPIPATISLDSSLSEFLTVTPQSPLVNSTAYTVRITGGVGGVQAATGETLVGDTVWSFSTTSTQPSVISVSPPRASTNVPLLPTITVTFNQPMDTATFTNSNFNFYKTTGSISDTLPRTITCNDPCTVATLQPANPLEYSTGYRLLLLNGATGLTDITGAPLDYTWSGTITSRANTNNGADLVLSALSGPASAFGGTTININSSVLNQGSGTAAASTANIYLSADNLISKTDLFLGSRSIPELIAGASNSEMISATLPANLAPGTYYLGAIADSTDAVPESNDANNAYVGSVFTVSGVDLIGTAISSISTAAAGTSISMSNTVKNQGTTGAGSFQVTLYLSTDNIITTSDIALLNRTVPSLAAGASHGAYSTMTVPSGTAPGTYYIGLVADSTNVVAEANETNNGKAGLTINITAGATRDLLMTAVTPNASSVKRGSKLSVANTAKNQGTASSTSFKVGFRLSVNTVYGDADDVSISTTRSISSLGAGSSSTATTSVTTSSSTPTGSYYVCAKADSASAVAESNENNNTLCSTGKVNVTN